MFARLRDNPAGLFHRELFTSSFMVPEKWSVHILSVINLGFHPESAMSRRRCNSYLVYMVYEAISIF